MKFTVEVLGRKLYVAGTCIREYASADQAQSIAERIGELEVRTIESAVTLAENLADMLEGPRM